MAKSKQADRIFKSDRRIRLGIWGLGRGMSFYRSAQALNFDIVAGCDFNQHMRDNFLKLNPNATATSDAKEFLAMNFDAVLLATFCPAHADDAIACLAAGKHVLSEVTSFHTVAEGVRLTDAVEKSGKVYNLAENYPFSAGNMWLARKWREGLFGELMYGEFEYVHECRTLAYTYIDGTPMNPGNQTHSWRSWLNFHYYNTHSLGPMMHITGKRPTRVTALPSTQVLAGYPFGGKGMGGAGPSLISMSNGGTVRNLMGATTNDSHVQRLWGTLGSADMSDGSLKLRLGASGGSPKFPVIPHWDELGDLAAKTGHGGGDFWVLYYFARQILTGEPAPFDIYNASDCTLPGILAYRSGAEGGRPLDVPDFRDKSQRDACRDDDYAQPRFDSKKDLFPAGADTSITNQFSVTMRDLINMACQFRAYRDWDKVAEDMVTPASVLNLGQAVAAGASRYREVLQTAKKIADAYPQSVGARVLREMMEVGHADEAVKPDFEKKIKAELGVLTRRVSKIEAARVRAATKKQAVVDPWTSPFVTSCKISKMFPRNGGVATVPRVSLASRAGWETLVANDEGPGLKFLNAHNVYGGKDGIAYMGFHARVAKAGEWLLNVGHDGGVRVFVDGKPVFAEPRRVNPARPDRSVVPVKLKAGKREIVIALDTDSGNGWGTFVRFAVPKKLRKKSVPVFPEPVAG
ncbi:MAG: hypothetical protein K8S99_01345 [Planctomycetes bacterium]|nr:hypothetical protein [Planctomycetota bacterium]